MLKVLFQYFIIVLTFNKSKLHYFGVFCEKMFLLHVCKKLNNNVELQNVHCKYIAVLSHIEKYLCEVYFMFTNFVGIWSMIFAM